MEMMRSVTMAGDSFPLSGTGMTGIYHIFSNILKKTKIVLDNTDNIYYIDIELCIIITLLNKLIFIRRYIKWI